MKTSDTITNAPKPIFIVQSHPGMDYVWSIETDATANKDDADLTECLPDTPEAKDFIATFNAWHEGMEVQNGFVEDSYFERDRPTPPPFDWDKWELVGVALAVRLSALAGPDCIIRYERALYGPKPHICLWSSE